MVMAQVRAIRTEEDYDAALVRIAELMDALSGPEGQIDDPDNPARIELDILVDLVEFYESKTVEMEFPTVVDAIEFKMDQMGLTQRDLIPFIGTRARVSEVLSGKRSITMSMARALNKHLGIPSDILLQNPGANFDDMFDDVETSRFPLTAMAKAGWLPNVIDLQDRAEELIGDLIERAGGREVAVASLYRKNDHRRLNAKTDGYALSAWCWQVMAQSQSKPPTVPYETGTVTKKFLRDVARLSLFEDGPKHAKDFLALHGIGMEVVPHLPKIYLDGAALRLAANRPIIGLTLRYDRIDNFWFTLLHELSHVGLHMDGSDEDAVFLDDHSLRNIDAAVKDSKETQADQWAEDALIPPQAWKNSAVCHHPTAMAVIDLAQEAQVHPAIIAGRVRYERGNFRLLSQFVGTGKVRRQFDANRSTDKMA